jgi:hypothetical protein
MASAVGLATRRATPGGLRWPRLARGLTWAGTRGSEPHGAAHEPPSKG